MFKYNSDFAHKAAKITPYYIATGTVIELGEMVKFTPGTGIVAIGDADQDDPYIGVAAEGHDGSTAGRNVGLEILIYDSPTAIFSQKCMNIITATGGSTTTFVVSGLLPQTNDLWNGGYLKIIACAADSSLNGKKIKITDSVGSTGTLTFAVQSGALASGDTAYLCPGPLAITEYGWDLESDGMLIDWDTSGGEAICIESVDVLNFRCRVFFRLHQFGNGPAAL